MRYLLVVGFSCEVYRHEPRARIFVGNRLIDEFNIPHTPDNMWKARQELLKKKSHILQPYPWSDIDNSNIKNFPPLKFYELEVDDEIRDLSICIDIDNHDSNHNNGFMTRSTLLKLKACTFFPLEEKLLWRLKKILGRHRFSKNCAWQYVFRNVLFDLATNGMYWKGVNGKKITTTVSSVLHGENIGGDGAYVCHLSKKYRILMPTLARASKHHFSYTITKYFFDKYHQHANQRNTN